MNTASTSALACSRSSEARPGPLFKTAPIIDSQPPRHVMIDIESLGTSSQAIILEIGATLFDPREGLSGSSIEMQIDPESCVDSGLKGDISTLRWWLGRVQAGASIPGFDPDRCAELRDGLTALQEWIDSIRNGHPEGRLVVWAKSPSFDLVILRSAYRACEIECPWDYWEERDVRTVLALAPSAGPKSTGKVAHRALADAEAQATEVAGVFRYLESPVPAYDTLEESWRIYRDTMPTGELLPTWRHLAGGVRNAFGVAIEHALSRRIGS